MSHITLNIVADSPADLADALNGIVATLLASTAAPAPSVEPAAAPAEAPAAKPRTRKAAEPKAEEQPAKVEEPAAKVEEPAAEPEAAAALTYAEVQAVVTKLAAKKGRDAVIAVFEQFGVDHGSKLTEAQWPEAIAAMSDALDAEALA